MQRIAACLWFDDKPEEAADFDVSISKDPTVKTITRHGENAAKVSGRSMGSVLTVTFQLAGQEFLALNGGPTLKFIEAASFAVNCET